MLTVARISRVRVRGGERAGGCDRGRQCKSIIFSPSLPIHPPHQITSQQDKTDPNDCQPNLSWPLVGSAKSSLQRCLYPLRSSTSWGHLTHLRIHRQLTLDQGSRPKLRLQCLRQATSTAQRLVSREAKPISTSRWQAGPLLGPPPISHNEQSVAAAAHFTLAMAQLSHPLNQFTALVVAASTQLLASRPQTLNSSASAAQA